MEVEADGSLFIVDFKTSATAISKPDAVKNLQLATYQLAITEGAFTQSTKSAGAELVYLGTESDEATKRTQPQIDIEAHKIKLNETAEGMGAATFFATVNKRCKGCPVRSSCPVQNDGRTVVEK